MSSAAPGEGFHRQRAKACLDSTASSLDAAPVGEIKADVLAAHSAKAQVFASAAIAHALLEIGDILRAGLRGSADE